MGLPIPWTAKEDAIVREYSIGKERGWARRASEAMKKAHSADCVYRRLAKLEYMAKLELQAAAQKALLAPKREVASLIPGRAPAQRWPDFLVDSPVLRRAS